MSGTLVGYGFARILIRLNCGLWHPIQLLLRATNYQPYWHGVQQHRADVCVISACPIFYTVFTSVPNMVFDLFLFITVWLGLKQFVLLLAVEQKDTWCYSFWMTMRVSKKKFLIPVRLMECPDRFSASKFRAYFIINNINIVPLVLCYRSKNWISVLYCSRCVSGLLKLIGFDFNTLIQLTN